jgi:antirestriction protein ArdC
MPCSASSGRHQPNSICLAARAGYAMEELVAEIGAAFLCADLGITPETRPDHAAYIASWLKVLKDDKRAIFTAASHAQKAADYLHGLQSQEAQP